MRNYGSKDRTRGARPASRIEQDTAVAVTVIRRMGFVLGRAHEVMESQLLDRGLHETASVLRDSLKPLIDALIHFELVERSEDDGE